MIEPPRPMTKRCKASKLDCKLFTWHSRHVKSGNASRQIVGVAAGGNGGGAGGQNGGNGGDVGSGGDGGGGDGGCGQIGRMMLENPESRKLRPVEQHETIACTTLKLLARCSSIITLRLFSKRDSSTGSRGLSAPMPYVLPQYTPWPLQPLRAKNAGVAAPPNASLTSAPSKIVSSVKGTVSTLTASSP